MEVRATVASYFEMLEAALRGEPFNKTAYRNALLPLLDGRTAGAVERKHQNISAILIEEGVPYISGYKPLHNYRGILRDEVLAQLLSRRTTRELIETEIERVPEFVPQSNLLDAWVDPPEPRPGTQRSTAAAASRPAAPVDYLLIEARNRALGRAGEKFVISLERERLIRARRERLARGSRTSRSPKATVPVTTFCRSTRIAGSV